MNRSISIIVSAVILALVAGLAVSQTYVRRQAGSNDIQYQDYSGNPGSLFWVNSATGSDCTSCGRDPSNRFARVDYAIGKCTGGKGDIIYVMPGHVEDGATTTLFDADTNTISIIGLGVGAKRPRFDYNNTADIVSIGASNVTIKNLAFRPSVSAVVIGVDVEANATHFTMTDCEFMVGEAAGTDEFISSVVLNSGASDAVIKNNKFFTAITDAHCTNAINLGVAGAVARVEITDNFFYGNWSTAAIIDGTTAVTELLISGNDIKVKDGEPGIELAATTTGLIVNNQIESTTVTCSAAIVAADASWFNNYCVTTDGAAAVPIGIAATTTTIAATLALHGTTLNDIETKVDLVQTATGVGTVFMVSKSLAHTAIVTGGADLTGTATGTLELVNVIILNGATVMDAGGGATNVQLYTDNAQGSAAFWITADSTFAASAALDIDTGSIVGGAGTASSTILLNGKKLKINTSAFDQTTNGNITVYMVFRRLSAGATISAS